MRRNRLAGMVLTVSVCFCWAGCFRGMTDFTSSLFACEHCGLHGGAHAEGCADCDHAEGCTEGTHADDICTQVECSVWEQPRELLPGNEWLAGMLTASCQAMLCSECGFGNRRDNCVKCGRWVGTSGVPARLCNSCGFGNKKDNCVKCGRWIGTSGVPAQLCNSCGFGNKKDNCVKCGRWLGGN